MDETLQCLNRVLSFVGISIFAKNNWDSPFYRVIQIFNLIIAIITFILTTGCIINSFSDLPALIESICIWTTGVILSISITICWVFRKRFRLFVLEMGFRDTILDVPLIHYVMGLESGGELLMELKELVVDSRERLLRFVRILLKCYVSSVFVTASLYIVGAIYRMLVREDQSLRILAFEMWFPWSLEDMRVYAASFIFHAYAGLICCSGYPGFQITIILLVGQSIRQLRILTFVISHQDELVKEITNMREGESLWQLYCTDILSQCIKHYITLKTFNNRVNVIFRPFYLTLILVATLLVCGCSTKIAISNKFALEVIKYYVHEFCFIIVVLMFCLLGQQLQDECEKLEGSILQKWYIYNAKHTKHLRIFKMAASQRMPIHIFGTITLSLPTFTWFIRTGTSFFTLMMSFMEEQ
ncbi:uncharacterized protein LOC105395621 [Plutella xylostella]|uniref:uncharacterized protein LOC105395621 n=1 Tax=Plutella xylostella TaxID=51655 RepID=UPI0020328424|nr:uncharacterized protein LOC105395621 [Plutella xylostella]